MLFSWMKSLIIYLGISGIVVNLSPGKKYKKYISFFSGMVVIMILAEPLTYIIGFTKGDVKVFEEKTDGYLNYNYILNEAADTYDYYDMSVEEAVKTSLAERNINAEIITVITNEDKSLAGIYVYICEDSLNKEVKGITDSEIKKYLKEVYNLENDSIYVIRR